MCRDEELANPFFSILRHESVTERSEVVESMLPRKASKYRTRKPYRKPTQVGEEIIQGARENSGQGTRQNNPVPSEEGVLFRVKRFTLSSPEKPQRNGGGDCLLKT